MTSSPPLSLPARCSIAALALLGMSGGWLILLSGGFQHQLHRYSRETISVTGAPAWLIAAIMFALGALGALALLRALHARLLWQVAASAAIVVPPVLFLLAM
jgi:TRAP-type C4-dicarboxylate transport system permease small subunit